MKSTPLQQVKEQFGEKAKLIDAVKKLATDKLWLDKVNAFKGIDRISSSKLLRLHEVLNHVQKEFGSRDKLIAAILELEKRVKDAGYKGRLEKYGTPQLVDLYRAASKRGQKLAAKATKAAPAKAKKPARSKKAQAKAKAA
jgi:hypothetical protein